MYPTQIKKTPPPFYFLLPPDSAHISRTTGPTEMVHLSIFAEFYKEYHYSVLKMTVQAIIIITLGAWPSPRVLSMGRHSRHMGTVLRADHAKPYWEHYHLLPWRNGSFSCSECYWQVGYMSLKIFKWCHIACLLTGKINIILKKILNVSFFLVTHWSYKGPVLT